MLLQKEILDLPFLGFQLSVVFTAAALGLVPWNELELGVCSLKMRLRQYWPRPVDR